MSSSGATGGTDPSAILADLWQLLQAVLDDSEPALEALGLSAKAFFLLEAVEANPFPAAIARRMHLPPPTVTYLIKQLEVMGFLERCAEPGDLRKFRLVRTPAGSEAVGRGLESIGKLFGERLSPIGAGELASFVKTLRRLAAGREGEA